MAAADARRRRSLGILLTTGPETGDLQRVDALARAADARGIDVRVFLMCEGVLGVEDPRLECLLESGAEVVVCASDAAAYGVANRDGVLWGSQYDLARIAEVSDRMISFA